MSRLAAAALTIVLALLAAAASAADYPKPQEGQWVAKDFRFHTGEVMAELKLQYRTIGDPKYPAVLMLHGQQAPVSKPDCVRATAELLKLDPVPFERIFEFRASDRRPASEKDANDLFGAYLFQIEQVVEAVDELEKATQ